MKRLPRETTIYSMSASNAPQLRVASGEEFCLETEDCYGGVLREAGAGLPEGSGDFANPATGPVHVEGAWPGDVLRVDVEGIEVRDHAVMRVQRGCGALGHAVQGDETVVLPIRDGAVEIRDGLSAPMQPMIGVIGTAPAGEPIPTITPGEHGGNLDCKEIIAGTSVYLPVAVEGGLLAVGDLHALMGDGEVCICGAEVSGQVLMRAWVVRNAPATPCVLTAEHLLLLASAEALDDCERMVLDKTHRFLCGDVGLSANDAARIMSLVGELRVCQVVDPLKTMKFLLPRTVLTSLGWSPSGA